MIKNKINQHLGVDRPIKYPYITNEQRNERPNGNLIESQKAINKKRKTENKMKKLAKDFNLGVGLDKVKCMKDSDGNIPALPEEFMNEAKGSFNTLISLSKTSLLEWYKIGRVVYYFKMTVKAQDFVKTCDTHLDGLNADQRGACWQVYDRWADVWEWYHKSGVKIMNVRSVWTAFKKHEAELEAGKMTEAELEAEEKEADEKEAEAKLKSLMNRAKNLLEEIRETSGGLTLAEEQALNIDIYKTMNLVADRVEDRAQEVKEAHNITDKAA